MIGQVEDNCFGDEKIVRQFSAEPMLQIARQTSSSNESRSLQLQVEAEQAVLPHDVPRQTSTRFLWAGLGVAALTLIGVAACVLLPTSANPSQHVPKLAFSTALPHQSLRSFRSTSSSSLDSSASPGHARTTALHPVMSMPVLRSGSDAALGQIPLTKRNAKSSQSGTSPKVRKYQLMWRPSGRSKSDYHYFVPQNDLSFESQSASTMNYFTRQKFLGTRKEGIHDGTFRLQFTLPGEDKSPKAIELVPLSKGEPTFAAVKMRLSLGATINSLAPDHVLQVVDLTEGGHAEESGLMEGDIIRAVSMPDVKEQRDELSQVWQQAANSFQKTFGVPVPIGSIPVPDSEEGMVILDRGYFAEVYAALQENKRVNGNNAEVVLLVERPSAP
jgi:hypothetical protein